MPSLLMAGAALVLPQPLVLPAFSLLFLSGALLVILLAGPGPEVAAGAKLEARDFAGLLTFLGFFAALLSEPEQVLPFLRGESDK